jgi:hypothetical protein
MSSISLSTILLRKRRGSSPSPFLPRAPRHSHTPSPVHEPEETLVRDVRAGQRPAEVVEKKLVVLLRRALVPVSQIRCSACGRGATLSR